MYVLLVLTMKLMANCDHFLGSKFLFTTISDFFRAKVIIASYTHHLKPRYVIFLFLLVISLLTIFKEQLCNTLIPTKTSPKMIKS